MRSPTTPSHELGANLDRDLKTIYTSHAALHNTAVKSPIVGAQFSLDSGNVIVTGTKLNCGTSLTSINQIVGALSTGATPNACTLSIGPSPNNPAQFDVYVFEPTAAGDTTPILSTTPRLVRWIATGTSPTNSTFEQTSFNYQNAGEVK